MWVPADAYTGYLVSYLLPEHVECLGSIADAAMRENLCNTYQSSGIGRKTIFEMYRVYRKLNIDERDNTKASMVHSLSCPTRPLNVTCVLFCCRSTHLAAGAGAAGDTRALGRLLAAGDLVARPLPA